MPELTHEIVRRISDFFYDHHRRGFEACDGLIDVAQVTDDLGSQHGPLISMKLYGEFYAPQHKRFIDLCHEFGIKVFHHDDGSCRAFLPDLVEMGIDILNPIQWNCPGMDRAELKREFGDRLCFHGGVDNQHILPFGTPEEVRAEVRALHRHCSPATARATSSPPATTSRPSRRSRTSSRCTTRRGGTGEQQITPRDAEGAEKAIRVLCVLCASAVRRLFAVTTVLVH